MKLVAVLNRLENSKEIDNYYLKAIKKFGGIPILINETNLNLLSLCRGVLLTGGDKKGKLDDYLIKYALDNHLPLLGICQGMQSMALYNTSNKLVDVDNHYTTNHMIYLKDSNLRKIVGKDNFIVNSFHHQQICSSKRFNIIARSEDGIIEAIENRNHPFQIGVQWHPERMINSNESKKIFESFMSNIKQSIF